MYEMRKNDVGVELLVTLKDPQGDAVDVSAASAIVFKFLKPDSTVLSATGSLSGTGADGKVRYVTQSGDVDQSGIWRYQVWVTLSGGVLHSDIGSFKVTDNLA